MKINYKYSFLYLLVILAVPFIFGANGKTVQAASEVPTPIKKQLPTESKNEDFKFTAQPGDSFTKMARKAVQTYGINKKIKLSGAQIVFAETVLTQGAGSPELNLGQSVTIEYSDVKSAVANAKKLTEAQKSAWSVYAATVNFNTDSVGQKN